LLYEVLEKFLFFIFSHGVNFLYPRGAVLRVSERKHCSFSRSLWAHIHTNSTPFNVFLCIGRDFHSPSSLPHAEFSTEPLISCLDLWYSVWELTAKHVGF